MVNTFIIIESSMRNPITITLQSVGKSGFMLANARLREVGGGATYRKATCQLT